MHVNGQTLCGRGAIFNHQNNTVHYVTHITDQVMP